jgi:hypothetical protein
MVIHLEKLIRRWVDKLVEEVKLQTYRLTVKGKPWRWKQYFEVDTIIKSPDSRRWKE